MTTIKSKAISQYVKSVSINNKNTGYQYLRRLLSFERYFSKTYNFTIDEYLIDKTFNINVYDLLSGYAFYLTNEYVSPDGFKLSNMTIKNTINSVRNFLEYHDIDINARKYLLKVKYPRAVRQYKEALSKNDISKILQSCVSYKLRTFVHLLAVTGCRATEACSIRLIDIDFENSKINIRGEYTKTKTTRYVFLTEELKFQLKEYLKYKYRKRVNSYKAGELPTVFTPIPKDTDLIFASYFREDKQNHNLPDIYTNLLNQFETTLDLLNMSAYESDVTKRRRKITFHSFRRFVKSVISDLGYSDFSEWYIGHSGSTYYRRSDKDKFELFKKIEPYLSFLDMTNLESRHADLQSKIEVIEQENKDLKDNMNKIMEMIQQNPQLANIKPEVLTKKQIT